VALLFRRATVNWPSSSGNVNYANGQTDRILVPHYKPSFFRCKHLRKLQMSYSVNLPPMYYVDFFKHFTRLTKLDLFGSLVDDGAFAVIGETCHLLQDLNAGRTWGGIHQTQAKF
jgi:hypothetical protein